MTRRKKPRTYHQKYPLTSGFLEALRNNELPKGPGACILQARILFALAIFQSLPTFPIYLYSLIQFYLSLFKQVTRTDSQNLQNNWQHTQQAANETQAEAAAQRDQSEATATAGTPAAAATTTTTTTATQQEGASRGAQGGAPTTTTANTTNTSNSNTANNDNRVPCTDWLQSFMFPIANHLSIADRQSTCLLLSLFLGYHFFKSSSTCANTSRNKWFVFTFCHSSRFER